MEMLPIYKLNGKLYFRDKRLAEYRNIDNPLDRIRFGNRHYEFEKPTEEDKKVVAKLYGETKGGE